MKRCLLAFLLLALATPVGATPVTLTGASLIAPACGWSAALPLPPLGGAVFSGLGPFAPACAGLTAAFDLGPGASSLISRSLIHYVDGLDNPFTAVVLNSEFRTTGGGTREVFALAPPLGHSVLGLFFTLALPEDAFGTGAGQTFTRIGDGGLYFFDLIYPFAAEDPVAPTPEPTTLLLWGTGAGGLALARWYRRRLGRLEKGVE